MEEYDARLPACHCLLLQELGYHPVREAKAFEGQAHAIILRPDQALRGQTFELSTAKSEKIIAPAPEKLARAQAI